MSYVLVCELHTFQDYNLDGNKIVKRIFFKDSFRDSLGSRNSKF